MYWHHFAVLDTRNVLQGVHLNVLLTVFLRVEVVNANLGIVLKRTVRAWQGGGERTIMSLTGDGKDTVTSLHGANADCMWGSALGHLKKPGCVSNVSS